MPKTSARKPISKTLRFEVFKRDGFVCQYCGAHPPDALLHADHIQSVKAGGLTEIDNLITACAPCNLGKGAVPLDVIPQSLSDKAEEVAEREAQIAGYYEILEARRARIEGEVWRVADAIETDASINGFSRARLQSIKRFIERLGLYETLEAADIARARMPFSLPQRFRYFCGICWSKIKGARPDA